MLYDYQNRKNDMFMYSPALDLLLKWGREHLFFPDNMIYLKNREEEWDDLKKKENISELFKFDQVETDVDDALEFLHNISCSEQESEEAWHLQFALEIFDNIVFFSEASEHFPFQDKDDPVDDLRVAADRLLKKISTDFSPSFLRLIPLNDWRRKIARRIPEKAEYLFSWYTDWCEVPADTIEQLIENWGDISQGRLEGIQLDSGMLTALISEIKADSELTAYIEKQALAETLLPEAVGRSFSLRLFAMSQNEAEYYPISETIQEKGLVACSCKIIEWIKNKMRSEAERLEGVFLGAFCGPLLSDSQRLGLFEDIENKLRDLDNSDLKNGSILESLIKWHSGEIDAKVFSELSFTHWLAGLKKSAVEIAVPVPDSADRFWHSVRNLQLAEIAPATSVKLIDRIKEFASSLSIKKKPAESFVMSDSDSKSEADEAGFQSEKNRFELPIKYKRKKLAILGDIDKHTELSGLSSFLNQVRYYFWNGVYKLSENPDEVAILSDTEQRNFVTDGLYRLPKDSYEYIIIFVALDKDIIDRAISGQELSDEDKKNIAILTYQPEEK